MLLFGDVAVEHFPKCSTEGVSLPHCSECRHVIPTGVFSRRLEKVTQARIMRVLCSSITGVCLLAEILVTKSAVLECIWSL
jgi:hypothetical protein